jgi:sugar lactone lactonase YvrE
MHDYMVKAVDLEGKVEEIVRVPNQPSGLGWLPDGRLLVVSMTDRKIMRLESQQLVEHADIWSLSSFHCNDMVVDGNGRAYVGNFGFDFMEGAEPHSAELVMVSSEGVAEIVAKDLSFPNGTVITPDGKTLIVGETMSGSLTAFDMAPDGQLLNRRLWAQLEEAVPDGICLDSEMGIWVASPISNEALRVVEGGEVTDRVKVETQAYACMLGGVDQKTLFILTANSSDPEECKQTRSGRIEIIDVEIAGAGLP